MRQKSQILKVGSTDFHRCEPLQYLYGLKLKGIAGRPCAGICAQRGRRAFSVEPVVSWDRRGLPFLSNVVSWALVFGDVAIAEFGLVSWAGSGRGFVGGLGTMI
jgi:hypothetical protein